MNSFEVTVLGSNSALPAHGRHPSAQFLRINHQSILVDCGEGTQIRLREFEQTNIYHISHIFITHVHGDHSLGLMGLVNTMKLMNRQKPLHIYAHQRIIEIFRLQAEKMNFQASFSICFIILPETGAGLLVQNPYFAVYFFQLDHRVPCTGFRFVETLGKKKINLEQLQRYKIPKEHWNAIQQGANYTLTDGTIIPHEELTHPHLPAKSYAYCSDTRYNENIIEHIANCDLAYIESTFTQSEQELATNRYHNTARDAATLAKKANVKRLLIGHFSSRYKQIERFKTEAEEVFKPTELAIEGQTFKI